MMLAVLILACAGAPADDEPSRPTGHTGGSSTDTGGSTTTPPPAFVQVGCAPQPDAMLRYDCTLELEPPGPVVLEVTPEGEPPLRFEGTGILIAWGLLGGVPHAWRAWAADHPEVEATGSFTPAEPGLDFIVEVTTPGEPATDAVLTQFGCDGTEVLVLFDGQGRPRWVEDPERLRAGTRKIRAFHPTSEGTVLVQYDNDALIELSWTGEVVLRLDRPGELPRPVHHDVTKLGDRIVTLDARATPAVGPQGPVDVVWDGFSIFEGATLVADWHAQGALDPAQGNPCCGDYWAADFPGAFDFAHSNAVAVDDEGNVYLSYRYIDTIQKVVGDPDRADFGTVLWTLVGDPTSPIDGDLVLTASVGGEASFGSPHHVQPVDGGIRLYDNRWDDRLDTRILELAIDEQAGTADIVSVLPVGERCPIQGSAFPLGDGEVLSVCSGDGAIFTLDPVSAARTWQAVPTCPQGGVGRPPYRAVPVVLPTG
jgi:hypothetical protein